MLKFFTFTEKYLQAVQQQEEGEEEEDDDDTKVKPTPQKRQCFFNPKSCCKAKWDEGNSNGGPGGLGARHGITIV